MKGLRGTAFDVFGKTEERRTERALIVEYRALHRRELLAGLTADKFGPGGGVRAFRKTSVATAMSRLSATSLARAKWNGLMAQWRSPGAPAQRQAAEFCELALPWHGGVGEIICY